MRSFLEAAMKGLMIFDDYPIGSAGLQATRGQLEVAMTHEAFPNDVAELKSLGWHFNGQRWVLQNQAQST